MNQTNTPRDEVKIGSERSFGLVFAGFFTLVGLWPLFKSESPRLWALGISVIFLLLAFAAPKILTPFNRLWFKFGLLLHRIVSPLIMFLMFFVVITPLGFLMRLSGKDPLRLRFDREVESYWIPRDPPGPTPESLKNQF
jgi:hypothetical protein